MAHPFIHVVNFEENAIHAGTEGAGVLPTQQLSGVEEVALVTSPDPGRGAAQSVLQQEVLCNHSNINVSQVMSSSPTTTPPIVVSIVAGACAGAISHSKLNPYQDDLMYAHVINSSHTHTHKKRLSSWWTAK